MSKSNELESDLLVMDFANCLVDQGFKVVPMYGVTKVNLQCTCGKGEGCQSPGKHPKAKNGVHSAIAEKSEVPRAFRGRTNLAIACGAVSGCVVLDIDPRNGGSDSFAKLLAVAGWSGDLETLKEETGGGGYHYYFIYPPGIKLPKSNPAFPGIDLLSDGSICVCAPSTHISGNPYRFMVKATGPTGPQDLRSGITEMPAGILNAWLNGSRAKRYDRSSNTKIPEGGRNTQLFLQARKLLPDIGNKDSVLAMMNALNKSQCEPPLDDSEVKSIVDSAVKYANPEVPETRLNFHRDREWGELRLLDSVFDNSLDTEIPESMAPAVLSKKAEDLARRLGSSKSAALQVAISGLSGVIGRRCQLFPKPDYRVIPNLSCALLGNPSAQKSPILKEMLQPLFNIEQALSRENEAKLSEHNKERFAKELEIAELKGKLKKTSENETEKQNLRQRIAELKIQIEEKFSPKRIMVNDVTIERLIELMRGNPYGISMVWDELSGLFKLFERDGRESERQMILSLISGDLGQMQDRVGRGHVYAEHVLLTIVGGVQPEVLREIMPKTLQKGSGEDGMLQRFPLVAFIDQPKSYTLVLDGKNAVLDKEYNQLFEKIVQPEAEEF